MGQRKPVELVRRQCNDSELQNLMTRQDYMTHQMPRYPSPRFPVVLVASHDSNAEESAWEDPATLDTFGFGSQGVCQCRVCPSCSDASCVVE